MQGMVDTEVKERSRPIRFGLSGHYSQVITTITVCPNMSVANPIEPELRINGSAVHSTFGENGKLGHPIRGCRTSCCILGVTRCELESHASDAESVSVLVYIYTNLRDFPHDRQFNGGVIIRQGLVLAIPLHFFS